MGLYKLPTSHLQQSTPWSMSLLGARELAQPRKAQPRSLGQHSSWEAWDLKTSARPPSFRGTVPGTILYVPQTLLQNYATPTSRTRRDMGSFSLPHSCSVHLDHCVLGSRPSPSTCSLLPISGSAFRRSQTKIPNIVRSSVI